MNELDTIEFALRTVLDELRKPAAQRGRKTDNGLKEIGQKALKSAPSMCW